MIKRFGLPLLTRCLLLAILVTFVFPSIPVSASITETTIDFENEQTGNPFPACSGAAGTDCHRASGTNLASWDGPGGLTYETVSSGYAQVDVWYLAATDGRYDGYKWVRFTAGSGAALQTVRLRSTDNTEFKLRQLKVRDASQSTAPSLLTVKVKRDGAVVGIRTYQMSGQGNEIFSTDTISNNPWMKSGEGENFDNIDTIEISGFNGAGFIIDSLQVGSTGPDNLKPTGAVSIQNGADTTSSRNVTLQVTGTDPESDPLEMRFSHDNGFWTDWEPFSPTKAWTLSEGEGFKMLFMQLRDSAGNVSNTAFASITLAIMYTVSFDKNGGDVEAVPSSLTVSPGVWIDQLPAAPSRAGYTFAGWNTERSGAGNTITAPAEVTADMTVYAQWQPVKPAGIPSITSTTTREDTQSSYGLEISRNIADGAEAAYVKITAITGGDLYHNDGVTPIHNGDFITFAQGAGLKFSPAPHTNSLAGDSFSFQVQAALDSHGTGLSAPVTAVITVTEVNDAPAAADDVLPNIEENTAQVTIPVLDVLANDNSGPANEHNQQLVVTLVQKQLGGEVQLDGPNIIFIPEANYAGTAQFRYTIQDNGTTSGVADPLESEAIVSFQIEPRAGQPAVTPAETYEDTQSTSGLVITAATAGGAVTTHYKISEITGGKLYKNDGTTPIPEGSFITAAEGGAGLKFTPEANAYGTDGFGFQVQAAPGTQGNRMSDTVPVTITVHEVNDDPQASDDVLADIEEDAGVQLIPIAQLLGNDTKGPDNESGQVLTVISVDQAVGGTAEIVESNIVFTPHPDYSGAAGFRYTVQDNGTTSGLPDAKSDTANVSLQIHPAADIPNVTGTSTAEDTRSDTGLVITRNAVDGPEVTHFLIGGITGGTLYKNDGTTLLHNGSLITVPEGEAGLKFKPEADAFGETGFGFHVQASLDANGTSVSGTAAAVILVTEVNDAPTAQNDTLQLVAYGTGEVLIPFSALTANDRPGPANEDGQELAVTAVSQATGGSVSIVDGQIKFVPDAGFLGTAGFTYEVTDNGTTAGDPDRKSHTGQVTFIIGDAAAPVITLYGDNPMYLLINEVFVEPGYSAEDDADGDLTADVEVTGSVLADQLGVYTLKYNVSDHSHHAAVEVTRQVHVVSNELEILSASHGELEPVFVPKETRYTLQLPYDVTVLDVTAVPVDPAAVVTINEQTAGDQGVQKVTLNTGKNTLVITVTAPGGSYTTYTLEITVDSPPAETEETPQSSAGPMPAPAPVPGVEKLYVDVEAAGKGHVSQTEITRTTKPDGTKRDNVTFTADKAAESAQKTVEAGSAAARIVIPDQKDEVSELRIDLPVQSLQKIADSKLGLELYTNNGMISIPNSSLQGLNGDVYFHIIPIKKEEERRQVEERARKEEVVREALGDGSILVVGRPMTIETNMTSRPVTITLPLLQTPVPADAKEREQFLSRLAVFIEHSDGEHVLVKPDVVSYKENMYGLAFRITKFSTFTIVDMQNAHAGQNPALGTNTHQRYMNGYEDGAFRPEQSVTRAEMAAMLHRLIGNTGAAVAAFGYSDVADSHWAHASIRFATDNTLMDGYPAGDFKPESGITRAEMAAVIARYMKLGNSDGAGFTDIDGHWASPYITQVETAGYLKGYEDGTFRPEQLLTRAEAVTVLNRVFNRGPLTGVTAPTWTDVPEAHWAFGDIEEASLNHSYDRTEAGTERLADVQ